MRFLLTLLLCCFALAPDQEARAQAVTRRAHSLAVDTAFLLPINGVKQYLEIKGASRTKPVLLFIHGGPAWPATPMNRKYHQNLANDFTFVSWDQRNCGKSQSDTTVALTPDLYVEDAHQGAFVWSDSQGPIFASTTSRYGTSGMRPYSVTLHTK